MPGSAPRLRLSPAPRDTRPPHPPASHCSTSALPSSRQSYSRLGRHGRRCRPRGSFRLGVMPEIPRCPVEDLAFVHGQVDGKFDHHAFLVVLRLGAIGETDLENVKALPTLLHQLKRITNHLIAVVALLVEVKNRAFNDHVTRLHRLI